MVVRKGETQAVTLPLDTGPQTSVPGPVPETAQELVWVPSPGAHQPTK